MDIKRKIYKNDKLIAALLFLFISLFFLLPAFLSKGIIVGGDWSFPYTKLQSDLWLQSALSPWRNFSLIGGYEPVRSSLPFIFLINLIFKLGLSGAFISKLILLAYFVAAGLSMYHLLRYFGLNKTSSFIGGFIFQTSPFMFNFTVIGWDYMLFSMSVLPLFILLFLRSVRENKVAYLIVCLLIYSLALANSTTIVWYSITILALGLSFLREKKLLRRYLIYSFLLHVFLIALNLYWLINLFTFKDPKVFGSDNVLSSVSLGMWTRFQLQNIVRGWGTIFNYSYESSYLKFLTLISFVGVLIVIFSAVKVKVLRNIHKISLLFITLYPFTLLMLGSYRLSKLPFTNIIRDPGRNIALLSLVSAIFMAAFLHYFYKKNRKIFYLSVLLVILNANPFILWKLYEDKGEIENIKLRTFEYAHDYIDVENFLFKKDIKSKVLKVPITSSSEDFSRKEFHGEYRGFQSSFYDITPAQGFVKITGKDTDVSNTFYAGFVRKLMEEFDDSVETIMKKLDVQYLVFYFDKMSPDYWYLFDKVSASNLFREVTRESLGYTSDRVAIFEVVDPSQKIKLSNNFIFTNEKRVYTYDTLLSYMDEYDVLLDENLANSEGYPRLVFPKRYYSVDLNNMKPAGFSLPRYVQPPSNLFSYQLNLKKERSRVENASSYREAYSLLINNNSRRLAEVVLHEEADTEISFKEYVDNYQKMQEVFSAVPLEERDLKYFLLIQDLFTHVNYADTVFAKHNFKMYKDISYTEEGGRLLFDDFKEWLLGNTTVCQGICYYFDEDGLGELIMSHVSDYEIIKSAESLDSDKLIEIYDFDSEDIALIDYGDFLSSTLFTSEKVNDDQLLKSLVALTRFSLQTTEQSSFVDEMDNVAYFKVEETVPSLNYEFSFKYDKMEPSVGIAIIEEYDSLKDEYLVGAKRDNYQKGRRLAYFLVPTNPEEIADKLFAVTRLLQSDVATKGFYILLFNISDSQGYKLKDFNFGIKQLPAIYYENIIPEIRSLEVQPDFKEESLTKYRVGNLGSLFGNHVLILNQQFNSEWKLYDEEGQEIFAPHFVANGYANSWILDENVLGGAKEIIIEFSPAKLSRVWLYFSVLLYTLLISYNIITLLKKLCKIRN